MVAYCERTYPLATFGQGELRDASSWGSAPWDVVIAGWALIDVLSDEERARFLEDVHGLLAPDGLLIFSSHNLACAHLVRGPLGASRPTIPSAWRASCCACRAASSTTGG